MDYTCHGNALLIGPSLPSIDRHQCAEFDILAPSLSDQTTMSLPHSIPLPITLLSLEPLYDVMAASAIRCDLQQVGNASRAHPVSSGIHLLSLFSRLQTGSSDIVKWPHRKVKIECCALLANESFVPPMDNHCRLDACFHMKFARFHCFGSSFPINQRTSMCRKTAFVSIKSKCLQRPLLPLTQLRSEFSANEDF